MSFVASREPAGRSPGAVVLGAAAAAAIVVAAVLYSPVFGGAAVCGVALVLLLALWPKLVFYGLMLGLTGWPYIVGIPLGRDLPIPIVLPVIGITFLFVLVRGALKLEPPLPPDGERTALQAAIACLAAILTLSVLLSADPGAGFKSLARVMIVPMMLFICTRHFVRDAATARNVLDLLLVGTAIGGTFAVYEWFLQRNPLIETFAPPVGDLADHVYWQVVGPGLVDTLYRSHGFGMNPIFFGGALAMMLPHAATRFARAQSWPVKLIFVVLGTLTLGGMVSTFSRGPLLAAGVGLVVLAVAYPSLRKYLVAALVLVAAYVAADLLKDKSALADRLGDGDNVTLRLKLWQTAWHMFLDHPGIGVGLGQFQDHQVKVVRDHGIGPFYEFGGDGRLEMLKTAEHGVLQLLAETGIVGGLAGAFVLACVVRRLFPAVFTERAEPRRSIVLAAGLAFLVGLTVGFTVTFYNSWEISSLIAVMLAILCNAGRSPRPAGDRTAAVLAPATA